DLVLGAMLGFFSGNAGLLRRFRVRLGLRLLSLLRAFGGKPSPLLLGQPGLFGRRDARFLRGNLGKLTPGELCVEAVRILGDEGIQCGLVADLLREFIVAAYVGLRSRGWGRGL